MQSGQSTQSTAVASWALVGHDGMLVTLKVLALLAGYALFVWIIMTQLERRYLVPAPVTSGAQIGAPGQIDPVSGSVEIRSSSEPGSRAPR